MIRAAAFYQPGLTPEQRGLLREIATDEGEKARASRLPAALPASHDPLAIYFSPETSRLSLPAALTPELRAKFGKFSHDKDALKRELRDAVVAQDKSSVSKRTKFFRDLADQQWPRFVALADLAEAIRRDLAARPPPPLPALPPRLPAGLADRIAVYKREKSALEQERRDYARAAFDLPSLPVFDPGASGNDRLRQIRESFRHRVELLQQRDAEFVQQNASRDEVLRQSLKSISDDLTAFARTEIDPDTGKPMDVRTLMRRINAIDQLFEKIGREEAIYHDYRTAMLEPGLSPEQRRLLFGAALVGLAQPLPTGARMPGARFLPV